MSKTLSLQTSLLIAMWILLVRMAFMQHGTQASIAIILIVPFTIWAVWEVIRLIYNRTVGAVDATAKRAAGSCSCTKDPRCPKHS